jgi:hypothetical protein
MSLQLTGNFDKLAIYEKVKQKTCDIIDAPAIPTAPQAHTVKIGKDENIAALITVDKRAHRVFKTIFHVPSSELGEIPKAVKWDDFKRVMVRVGFTAEKLRVVHVSSCLCLPRTLSVAFSFMSRTLIATYHLCWLDVSDGGLSECMAGAARCSS